MASWTGYASAAMAAICAQREEQFRHLASNGISRSTMDSFEAFLTAAGTLVRPSLLVRCRIGREGYDVRVVVDKAIARVRLTQALLPFLRRTLHRLHRPADFFMLLSDSIYVARTHRAKFVEFLRHVPLLRCDQRIDDVVSSHSILIPDYSIVDAGYYDELVAIRRAADAIPFEERLDVVMWRGTLSGPGYPDLSNYHDFARYTLLRTSLERPDVLDARLVTYDNMSDSDSAVALQRHLYGLFGDPFERLPAESFVRYKHLISLDGAVAAWKRVPTILASGSVLLLQHRWKQFFYPGLKPWVHYVPVRDDISNLVEAHEWLLAHPLEAGRIAGNGRQFAEEVLHPAMLDTYLVDIINTCSGLSRTVDRRATRV